MIRVLVVAALALSSVEGVPQAAAPQAAEPFNGKDLSGWKLKGPEAKSKWKVGKASLDLNQALPPGRPSTRIADRRGFRCEWHRVLQSHGRNRG